jgi:hypothetical protein
MNGKNGGILRSGAGCMEKGFIFRIETSIRGQLETCIQTERSRNVAEDTGNTDRKKPGPSSAEEDLIPSEIGKKLKTLYDDVVEQDVPDRFLDLLDKLEKSEKDGK